MVISENLAIAFSLDHKRSHSNFRSEMKRDHGDLPLRSPTDSQQIFDLLLSLMEERNANQKLFNT